MTDYYEDVIFHNKLKSTCNNGPQITKQDLIDAIYKWDGETWAPEGFTLGSSYAEFNGVYPQGNQSANLFVVLLTDSNYDPILVTDQGFVVKKDLSAGELLGTNQGEVWIGHGRNNSSDVPKIIMMHSGYETLYLRKLVGTSVSQPANLNLGKLEVQSANNVFAVTAGDNGANQDTYLIPQNPSQGGLGLGTANYPFKWIDATTVFTNGINYLSGGTINVYCNITTNGNVTINKATPILQLKATSGDPMIEFYDTSTLKMNLAYSAAGDYFYLRDIVGSKDVFQATHAGQLALPVNGSTGGLRIGDDAYLYRGSTNTLYVYRNIEPGADSDTGYLGEGGRYWYGLVANYIYYRTAIQFDEYDDLAIAKLWGEKNQTLPADYDKTKLEPPTDDPFKIIKGSKDKANTEEFFDVGKVNGFLMGCVKALAKKQDEHDALLLKLLNEVESLRAEIAS